VNQHWHIAIKHIPNKLQPQDFTALPIRIQSKRSCLWRILFGLKFWSGGQFIVLPYFSCQFIGSENESKSITLIGSENDSNSIAQITTTQFVHRDCPYFTRVCGLCQHPSLSNAGNVSGHHLAGSNKPGCWPSFISFVVSFSSVQICHPCHFPSYSRWVCILIRTWKSTMLSSLSPASFELINYRVFFTNSTKRPPIWCVLTTRQLVSALQVASI